MMVTKFRAFQLDSEGSLFSYFKPNQYFLIEARLPKGGLDVLKADLEYHGKTHVDVLHITSWDVDHCKYDDLVQILNHLRPNTIESPSYLPDSDTGKLCRRTLIGYDDIHQQYKPNVKVMSREYITNLSNAQTLGSNNVVYHSTYDSDIKNDMSLIKLFRSDGFNVLSLGDCESQEIANYLLRAGFITSEVDVLILPHHGADNGFLTGEFLDKVKPRIAVCSSNTGNQYEHPKPNIRALLSTRNIPLMTTKRGDVIVLHEENTTSSRALNLISNNEEKEADITFTPKRF
jgi:competence protein ComEC